MNASRSLSFSHGLSSVLHLLGALIIANLVSSSIFAGQFPTFSVEELQEIAETCEWKVAPSDWGNIFQSKEFSYKGYKVKIRLIPYKEFWNAAQPIAYFGANLLFNHGGSYYWSNEPNDQFNHQEKWLVSMLHRKGLFNLLDESERRRFERWLNSQFDD